ncbi:hypothetical protein BOX15_Mlig027717g1 [Macrostomum lignano]|uniref:ELM2 domain-containing protein n=1 Tax=Macrostomum lignano TaxID=282301 RepID=A0A267EN31_9PLAT|nr:hypothetical protein BOX15_Mlig027717g1 [Macrostomum lignano]
MRSDSAAASTDTSGDAARKDTAAATSSPPPTPRSRDLRRSGRSRGRSSGPLDDQPASHRINGVEYRLGDCCYAEEPGRPDEPYIIGQLEEMRVSRREAASVRLRVFCRTQDVPDAAYEAQGCRDSMFEGDPRQEEARLRELFLSEARESLPAASLRGRCRVDRYTDLAAASAGYRLRPDAFYCVFNYSPETRRLSSTRTEIRVGPSFQAELPDCRDEVPQMHPLADEAGRVWETPRWLPGHLEDEELRMYIRAARSLAAFAGFCDLGSASEGQASAGTDRTAQRALDALHDLDYDVRLALRVLVRNPRLNGAGGGGFDDGDCGAPWSRECVRRFQKGVRQYGKNFCRIRRELLPERRVGQLVHFYYLWKRSPACPNGARSAGRRGGGGGAASPAAQFEPLCRNCEQIPAAGDGDPLCGECRQFYLKYGEDRPCHSSRAGASADDTDGANEVASVKAEATAAASIAHTAEAGAGADAVDGDAEGEREDSDSSSSEDSSSSSDNSIDEAIAASDDPPSTSRTASRRDSPSPPPPSSTTPPSPTPSRPAPVCSPAPLPCRLAGAHVSSGGRCLQRVWLRSGGRNSCARTDLHFQAPATASRADSSRQPTCRPVAAAPASSSVPAASPWPTSAPLSRPRSTVGAAAEEQQRKMLAAAWQAEQARLAEFAYLQSASCSSARQPPPPHFGPLMQPPLSPHEFAGHSAAFGPDPFAAFGRPAMPLQPPPSPHHHQRQQLMQHHLFRAPQPPPSSEFAPLFAAAAAAASQQHHQQQQLHQSIAQRHQHQVMCDPRCLPFDPALLAFPPLPSPR